MSTPDENLPKESRCGDTIFFITPLPFNLSPILCYICLHIIHNLCFYKTSFKAPVTYEDGKEMASRINAFSYRECSAKTKEGVRELFEMATWAALKVSKRRKDGCALL